LFYFFITVPPCAAMMAKMQAKKSTGGDNRALAIVSRRIGGKR